MKSYRVRRPKAYDELLNLLRDREQGVFSTYKSALVFAAAVGFKERKRVAFTDLGEPIALTLFSENQDQPLEKWHKNLWLKYCQPLDFGYLLGSR